jgi:hypothetical protein
MHTTIPTATSAYEQTRPLSPASTKEHKQRRVSGLLPDSRLSLRVRESLFFEPPFFFRPLPGPCAYSLYAVQGICSKKQCWLDESCLTSFGSCPGKGRGFGTTQNRVLIIGTIFSVPYVSKTCFLHTQNTCCTFLMQYLYNLKLCTRSLS